MLFWLNGLAQEGRVGILHIQPYLASYPMSELDNEFILTYIAHIYEIVIMQLWKKSYSSYSYLQACKTQP